MSAKPGEHEHIEPQIGKTVMTLLRAWPLRARVERPTIANSTRLTPRFLTISVLFGFPLYRGISRRAEIAAEAGDLRCSGD
jgi:hypothetical protein